MLSFPDGSNKELDSDEIELIVEEDYEKDGVIFYERELEVLYDALKELKVSLKEKDTYKMEIINSILKKLPKLDYKQTKKS